MNKMTAKEAAEIIIDPRKYTISEINAAKRYAVSILRRVASGEMAEMIHAHWIEDNGTQICSNCGEEHEWSDYRASYCDDCGAIMDEQTCCHSSYGESKHN